MEEEVEVIGAEVVEYHPEVILLVSHYQSFVDNCVCRGSQSFEISGSEIYVTITLTVPPTTSVGHRPRRGIGHGRRGDPLRGLPCRWPDLPGIRQRH